jgi:hypothetical protein
VTTDANSALANPMFTNAQTGDYTLQPNSPALGMGFTTSGVPLAPSSVGLSTECTAFASARLQHF